MANTAQHTNTCTISKSSKILYACLLGEITKIQTNQSDEQQFLFLFPSICEQKSLKVLNLWGELYQVYMALLPV